MAASNWQWVYWDLEFLAWMWAESGDPASDLPYFFARDLYLSALISDVRAALQRISDERAKLSNSFSTTDALANDDQGITTRDYSSVILVPSNGYTFERTPTQVRAHCLQCIARVVQVAKRVKKLMMQVNELTLL